VTLLGQFGNAGSLIRGALLELGRRRVVGDGDGEVDEVVHGDRFLGGVGSVDVGHATR
jgi:hypothetical protein